MLQRIQSVYIFIAAALIFTLFKFKFADLNVSNELYVFNSGGIYKGEEKVFNGLPIIILIGIIALLQLIALFLYKKRIRQIRLLVFNIVLLFGLFGLFFYFIYTGFDDVQVAYKAPTVFPLIAVIMNWLAIRAIGKDEALVRSLDRIR